MRTEEPSDHKKRRHPKAVNGVVKNLEDRTLLPEQPGRMQHNSQREQNTSREIKVTQPLMYKG